MDSQVLGWASEITYSGTPFLCGGCVPRPPAMPETVDSTEPYIYPVCTYIYVYTYGKV